MKNILTIENLGHTYTDGQREVEVLKGVSATFQSGQIYCLLGESGSGKTTLISLLSALDKIQHGSIKYNNKSIKAIGETNFRRRYVSIVFQSYNLIRYMTARENVEIALDFARPGPATGFQDQVLEKKQSSKQTAYAALAAVGLKPSEADRLVQKLSGGQQQRVAIARAIAADTPIIVADEPTGNLDEKTAAKILELFKSLAESGKIVIIVTHSQTVSKILNAKILHIHSGLLK